MVIFNEFERAGLRYRFLTKHIIKKYFKRNEKYLKFFLYLIKFDRKGYAIGFSFKISSNNFYPVNNKLVVYYQTNENSFKVEDLALIGSIVLEDIFAKNKSAEKAFDFFVRKVVEAHKILASQARKEADCIRKQLSKKTQEVLFHGSAVSDWALIESKKF